ncbi:MAG TPA: hypothetical protein VG937_18515 [Polyangiaceae bacterium]|nr:hypothetical protein [Polyangiaceae bacterium]
MPLSELYQVDWRIFMTAAAAWLDGKSPYGALSSDFGAGAFAYPPTALPWLALFLPARGAGFYIWSLLELSLWWVLIRKDLRSQWVLIFWSPMILHFYEGQSTLAIALVVWAAARAERRGFLWGLALAWALTKPQVALFPLGFLLFRERAAPLRFRLWAGIALGTLLLALPATLRHPGIWLEWLESFASYRSRLLQLAPWQGASALLVLLVFVLWYRSRRGGFEWLLAAAVFPQTSFYSTVVLLPALRPSPSYWSLAGLALAALLQGPMSYGTLTWLLAGHLLAAWMITGGPRVAGSAADRDGRSPASRSGERGP